MNYEVAVVGGGISGLVAAYTLKNAGIKATVFERASFPGGRMSSDAVDGYVIDRGAYTIPSFYTELNTFLAGIGRKRDLVETPSTSSTFRYGREYSFTLGSPTGLLKYRLLSVKNKMDVVKIMHHAQIMGKALDLSSPTAQSFQLEKQSASEYLLQRYNRDLLELFAYPLFSELFLGNPEFNSELALLSMLGNPAVFNIDAFENGMGSLPEYLAGTLDVRLNTPVSRIERVCDKGYEIESGGENKTVSRCDAVILAAPLPGLADILVDASMELKASMKDITYTPAIVTAWGLERRDAGRSMINNYLRNETKLISTVVFDHLKSARRVPAGKGLVTVVLKEAASRDLYEASEARIQSEVLAEMEKVLPSFGRRVTFSRMYRWEHAVLQFPPGALQKKQAMKKMFSEQLENIHVASDSFYRTSIETCLQTGLKAAASIIDTFRRSADG